MIQRKSIAFHTVGCRLNRSETHVLKNLFEKSRFRVVASLEKADIAVINTCTVTEHGDRDTIKLVRKIARSNPHAHIALIGCQAELQKDRLQGLPNVRWIVGHERKMDLPGIFDAFPAAPVPHVVTPPISGERFTMPATGFSRTHTRANLKIQDGCDAYCSFCVIPFARGRARSRYFDDIIHEARTLAEAGHREVVLTGIHLGKYRDEDKTVLDVLSAIQKIRGIRRVRLSSIEPKTISDELLTMMAVPGTKICRHLHVPLQHTHDGILRLMNRPYTFEEFIAFARNAVDRVPGICLGTDIIAGFPGETEACFGEALERLGRAPFHYFHVFSYSDRRLARSKDFPLKVPRETIAGRSRLLRELGSRKRRAYYQNFLGKTRKVLLEQKKNGWWRGLTDNFIHVRVASERDLSNRFVDIRLEQIDRQEVVGTLTP